MTKIGCHVSIAGGIQNAPERAAALGCETFQCFSRSPQGGPAPKLTPEVVEQFNLQLKAYNFKQFYIHAPYYTNFASDVAKTRGFSVAVAREELERGTTLGASYVVIHLGSAKDSNRDEAVARAADSVKKILQDYKGNTKLLLEISAGTGNVIGDTFKELNTIMAGTKSSALGGICFDTCHAFASGYDLTEKTFKDFDKIIGLEKIKLLHVNDSKVGLGEHRDRHEHIGEGKIGRDRLAVIAKIKAFLDVDWVLETKHDKVEQDLKLLKAIRGKSSTK
jgi:deoxyribonuclease IV